MKTFASPRAGERGRVASSASKSGEGISVSVLKPRSPVLKSDCFDRNENYFVLWRCLHLDVVTSP